MKTSAAILAIGSELTSAQIQNTNTFHLTKKLKGLGVVVETHLTIPDDRERIQKSLADLAMNHQLILVTGGLGPTSDDFTRDEISNWSKCPLVFDEGSWTWVQTRLIERGVPVREAHKQQCYYPQGSQIWKNQRGTAHGFSLEVQGSLICALPGPPGEIDSIWDPHLRSYIEVYTEKWPRFLTKSWDTLGLGESEVAHLAESATEGVAQIERGYRVHYPYVEFKITYSAKDHAQLHKVFTKVDTALESVTVARDGTDMAEHLAMELKALQIPICIYDTCSGVFLLHRLYSHLKPLTAKALLSYIAGTSDGCLYSQYSKGLILELHPKMDGGAVCKIRKANKIYTIYLDHPFQKILMHERGVQYITEMAMAFWLKQLSKFKK